MDAVTVQRHQVEKIQEGQYITDASDIGLPPGVWPAALTFVRGPLSYTLKRADTDRDREGEWLSVDYTDEPNEILLRVMND